VNEELIASVQYFLELKSMLSKAIGSFSANLSEIFSGLTRHSVIRRGLLGMIR